MSAETTTISLDEIDPALAAAVPGPGEDDQRLAVAVLQLLAGGVLGRPRAGSRLRGLALAGMPHRLRHAGTDLFAWSAWDPLFLALVVGAPEVGPMGWVFFEEQWLVENCGLTRLTFPRAGRWRMGLWRSSCRAARRDTGDLADRRRP